VLRSSMLTFLLLAAAACSTRADSSKQVALLNVLRPDARALRGDQPGVRQVLGEEDRQRVTVNQSARRLRQAGSRGAGGPGGRLVTLALAYDVDARTGSAS
jgi:hypothetical protein